MGSSGQGFPYESEHLQCFYWTLDAWFLFCWVKTGEITANCRLSSIYETCQIPPRSRGMVNSGISCAFSGLLAWSRTTVDSSLISTSLKSWAPLGFQSHTPLVSHNNGATFCNETVTMAAPQALWIWGLEYSKLSPVMNECKFQVFTGQEITGV